MRLAPAIAGRSREFRRQPMARRLDSSAETTGLEDATMRDGLEILAAPFFAIIDFALAAPAAAALASVVGAAALAVLVAIA